MNPFLARRRPEVLVHGVEATHRAPLDDYLEQMDANLERIAEALELLCDQISDIVEALPETDRNMRSK